MVLLSIGGHWQKIMASVQREVFMAEIAQLGER